MPDILDIRFGIMADDLLKAPPHARHPVHLVCDLVIVTHLERFAHSSEVLKVIWRVDGL